MEIKSETSKTSPTNWPLGVGVGLVLLVVFMAAIGDATAVTFFLGLVGIALLVVGLTRRR